MDRSQVAAKNRERTSDALKAASGIFSFFSKLTGDERVEDASKISKGATELYEGGAGEIHEKLIKSGYNQDQEYAADAVAMKILIYAGYQPSAFGAYLGRAFSSEKQSKGMSLGGFAAGTLFSTHPMDEKRIERITKMVSGWIPGPESQTREQRFKSMQAGQ
jgi:predicted Zn-dependent protease